MPKYLNLPYPIFFSPYPEQHDFPMESASVKYLKLNVYAKGLCKILINLDSSKYDFLIDELIKSGWAVPDACDLDLHIYRITVSNMVFLERLLNTFIMVEPKIQNISAEVLNANLLVKLLNQELIATKNIKWLLSTMLRISYI